jgi:WD40 repeat protein
VAGYGVGFDITPDGAMVASGSADGQLLIYDHAYAKVLSRLPTDQKNDVVLDVAWNPVLFSTVAAGLWSGDIVIWQ